MRGFVWALISLLLVSCGTSSRSMRSDEKGQSVPTGKIETADLSWAEAQERKERLSDVTYDLKVDLSGGDSKDIDARYKGDLTIRFQLKDPAKNLRVDFFEGEITSLRVNGKDQSLAQKKKYEIELPAASLASGPNEVQIHYSQKYSRNGEGLHRFIDPVDGRVYLHSQFESYDANKFMPCFDQPDLRAVLNLSVVAPKTWTVVSSSIETSKKESGAKNRLWIFEPSAKISTYLFSLHAGPYAMYQDVYRRPDSSRLPLRLFVRESLKGFLKHKDWFKTTKDGIGFFENYFGIRYPFTKLDQLVVPEFNSGGMENVGAITYSEWSLPRSATTRKMRRGLSGLVLHEIAHMWFGDLVTMAWWNDLWLNESFATYMSALALSEATEFKEAWQVFAAGTKSRAYVEDAMVTTHPIEATISRVKEATSIFDGITYNKGASVLKQLGFYMTSDDFRSGVRDYFKTYAFQNTRLEQFVGSLQKHTKKDLNHWADRWLRQSGTDQVAAVWTCEGTRLRKIDLKLETLTGRKSRPQSLEVALYKKVAGRVLVQNRIRADFEGAELIQTQALQGDWECPDFVYPNHGDHGYVLVKLDEKSLAFLPQSISQFDDAMTRSLVWNDLWRMVRDTEISLKTYVEIVSGNFSSENDEIILQQIVATITRPDGSILSYWPRERAASTAERAKFVLKMENEFQRRLKAAPSGSDDEKNWYDAFVRVAESPASIEQLSRWYAAGRISKNFPLDVDRAWGIAALMARFGHPKASLVLRQMKTKDVTDRGVKASLAVQAVVPVLEVKKKFVGELTADDSAAKRSADEAREVLNSLFPPEQQVLKLEFAKNFFAYLEKNRNSEDPGRVSAVLGNLMPLSCESEGSRRLKEKVNTYSDMNPTFKKRFLMRLEEDERCQRIRSRSSL